MDSTGDLDAAIEMLCVHGWFAERPPDLRAALAEMARLRDYAAGEALYHYGDAPNGIFGLVRGALDITIPRADGMDITVHRTEPGFWIGDLALCGLPIYGRFRSYKGGHGLNALVLQGLFSSQANYEIVYAEDLPLGYDALNDMPDGLEVRPYLRSVG